MVASENLINDLGATALMELEKGNIDDLVGRVWIHCPGVENYVMCAAKHDLTLAVELSGVIGSEKSLSFVKRSDEKKIKFFYIPLTLEKKTPMYESGSDILTIGNYPIHIMEDRMMDVFWEYFNEYDRQQEEKSTNKPRMSHADSKKFYDSKIFFNDHIFHYRRAIEGGTEKVQKEIAEDIIKYAEGKIFSNIIDDMVAISGDNSVEADKRLKAVELYSSLVHSFMTDDFKAAAEYKRQTESLKKEIRPFSDTR